MKTLLSLLSLAAVVSIAGCAAPETPAAGPNRATVAPTKDDAPMTGSRIAKRDSDRSVRGTDNASFRKDNDIRSIHDMPGVGRSSN
ncbi:MAG: hypothetical protein ACKVQR_02360 [Aquabacterium sp.]